MFKIVRSCRWRSVPLFIYLFAMNVASGLLSLYHRSILSKSSASGPHCEWAYEISDCPSDARMMSSGPGSASAVVEDEWTAAGHFHTENVSREIISRSDQNSKPYPTPYLLGTARLYFPNVG